MTLHTATAIIDLDALSDNYQLIQSLSPKAKILAVLKANSYGHGLELIAKALPNADAFGVARIDEALALRAAGIVKPIVLLEGFFAKEDIDILAASNLQTIVHNEQQLAAILDAKLDAPLKVWLKIDTGMHRLGINPEQLAHFYQALSQSKNVQQPIVLMSHLGCADDKNNLATAKQISLFDQLSADLPLEKSLANSAGVLLWPESHYQWIRPGLLLYGVSPLAADSYIDGIAPVMTLQSSLISVREIAAGSAVGYGGAWVSESNTIIGVVAIGYGDGYPRHAPNGTPVLINGRRVPLIGRVTMDMITVDLGAQSQDSVGDIATLWGKGLAVEEVAEFATTIPYELLCNITRRVHIQLAK
ncbi:alanine racemase [Colwellia sp. MB02u-18]|nr:alanine racemase [Colwellia sp. MB3u-45]MBA6267956.1 alanine racemase [Colwellia sp. MB3u-43]MBA6321615.1 alanine racemase [Colwellia sp. MB02u-19]MBA6325386.1 alanine racemase [Colwellia sp. MB02u-18]MBA6330053.1 alanine racemase [Colwellia sp. MB02u-12]MBA6344424.1 alanine racemase [Colwellia sp. MB02u-1]